MWISGDQLNVRLAASPDGRQGLCQFEFVVTDQRARSSRVIDVRTLNATQLSNGLTVQLPADSLNTADLYLAAYLTDSSGNTSELSDSLAVEMT